MSTSQLKIFAVNADKISEKSVPASRKMRTVSFILFFCILFLFRNAVHGSNNEQWQLRRSGQSTHSSSSSYVDPPAHTPQPVLSASQIRHLEDWDRYQKSLSLFRINKNHENERRQHAAQRLSAVQESLAEPAELNSVDNVRFYSVGQILQQGGSFWIATVSADNLQIPDGISRLSPAQTIIYERIKHREPTNPGDYQIPPVSFKAGDFIVIPQENVQDGVKKIAKMHGSRGMVSILPGTVDGVIEFKPGYVLMRRIGRHPVTGERRNRAHAVYWARMWIVRDLLPTVEEQAREPPYFC